MGVESTKSPSRFERYFDVLEWSSAIAGAAGVALIAIVVVVNILARIAGLPSLGLLELTASLMMIIAFLPLSAGQKEEHIKMTLITDRVKGRNRRILTYVEYALVMGLCALMLWKSTALSLKSIAIREGTEGVVAYPLWLIKMCLPVGLLLLAVRLILQVYHLSATRQGKGKTS